MHIFKVSMYVIFEWKFGVENTYFRFSLLGSAQEDTVKDFCGDACNKRTQSTLFNRQGIAGLYLECMVLSFAIETRLQSIFKYCYTGIQAHANYGSKSSCRRKNKLFQEDMEAGKVL